MAKEVIGVEVRAELDKFKADLNKIPAIGDRIGKAFSGRLSKDVTDLGKKGSEAGDRVADGALKAVLGVEALKKAFDLAVRGATALLSRSAQIDRNVTPAFERLKDSGVALVDQFLDPLTTTLVGVSDGVATLFGQMEDTGVVEDFGEAFKTAFIEVMLPAAVFSVGEIEKAVKGLKTTFLAVATPLKATEALWVTFTGSVEDSIPLWKEALALEDQLHEQVTEFAGVDDASLERLDTLIAKLREAFAVGAGGRVRDTGAEDDASAAADIVANAEKALTGVITEEVAEQDKARAEGLESRKQMEKDAHDHSLGLIAEEAAAREAAFQEAVQFANVFGNAFVSISSDVTDLVVQDIERTTKNRKQAAIEAFLAEQGQAIAQAHVLRELGALNAFATAPNYVAGVIMAVAAQAQGWANLAIIAAASPPSFHMGVDEVLSQHRPSGRGRGLAPDEVPATLLVGEGVKTREEVRRDREGGGMAVFALQVGHKTTETMLSENLRTGTGALNRRLNEARPRSVGRRNPIFGR